jgi:hypothetical protein
MRLNEITKRPDTLYLMVDYGFEAEKIAKVAQKRGIEVYDMGKPSVKPMAFGVKPNSMDASIFMDKLNTWGYNFKDVSSLWSTKPAVTKAIDSGDTDRVAKAFTDKNIEQEFGKD